MPQTLLFIDDLVFVVRFNHFVIVIFVAVVVAEAGVIFVVMVTSRDNDG